MCQYHHDANKNLSEEDRKKKESWVYEKLLFST